MNARPAAAPDPSSHCIPDVELLNCDLVMKGGITSGVVYPKAVVQLAHRYRIRSIGGTSVGAIAAALTAAAEYWRQTHPQELDAQNQRVGDVIAAMQQAGWDSTDPQAARAEARLTGASNPHGARGYAALYAIPQELGSNLLGMFQPSLQTRGLFTYLISILAATTAGGKIFAAIVRQFYVIRSLVALLCVLMALSFLRHPNLAIWLTGAGGILIGGWLLWTLLWPLASHLMRKDPNQVEPSSNTKGLIAVPFLVLAAAGAFMLIRSGLGWTHIGAWTGRQIAGHPALAAAIVVALALILGWTWIKPVLLQRLPGDRRRDAGQILDWLSVAAFLIGASMLIWHLWTPIQRHRQAAGIAGAGFLIGWVAGGIVALAWYLLVAVPKNDNGICTGLGNDWALTNWLTAKIDRVAGVEGRTDPDHRHLTFRDLQDCKITFVAITSDLKRGVPLDVPNALANYRFRPDQFARFFPPSVLHQLGVMDQEAHLSTPKPFPEWQDVPVVVAARMSMSFPVLFSAVPVYHATAESIEASKANWLSDGGIVSNFPLHKFDRALPSWPTFAIDLIEKEGRPTGPVDTQFLLNPVSDAQAIGLPTCLQGANPAPEEIAETVTAFRQAQSQVETGDLLGLASRILNTARGWMDNSQKTLPGYAERIVGVYLYKGEGGLNLDMDARTISRLADRGLCAAHTLATSWEPLGGDRAGNQWQQHRWLRYRILMREVEQLAREWSFVYDPESATIKPVQKPSLRELAGAAGDVLREPLVFNWANPAAATDGVDLTDSFDSYARAASRGVDKWAEMSSEANLDPQVFDEARAPALHPKRFLIPPFE